MYVFMKSKITIKVFGGLVALFVVYVLIYVVFSVNGQYQPFNVGANGVKAHAWAPLGFYDPNHPWKRSMTAQENPGMKTGGWSEFMLIIFYPLWNIDIRHFHDKV
jgi:hypothetical protein